MNASLDHHIFRRSLPLRSLLLFSLALLASAQASAAISGTIFGQLQTNEIRAQGCQSVDPAGCLHNTSASYRPMPHTLLRFHVIPANGNQITDYIYTKTDASGYFQVDWEDWTRSSFPTSVEFTVIFERPHSDLPFESTTRPARRFRVLGANGEQTQTTVVYTVSTSLKWISRTLSAGDSVATFLTATEVVDRAIDGRNAAPLTQSTSVVLGTTVTGLDLLTRQPSQVGGGPPSSWGFTPTSSRIYLALGTPVSSPWTVAHEFGHIVHWSSLGVAIGYADLFANYQACDSGSSPPPPGWQRITRECERTASVEGFADFVASVWSWRRDAASPLSPTGFTGATSTTRLSIEVTESTLCDLPRAFQFPWCHTQYMWDLFDSAGDDDGFGDPIQNRTLRHVADTWDAFPDFCYHPWLDVDNGCVNEGGVSALNHLDFERNWPAIDANRMRAVLVHNNVGAGTPED